MNYSPLDSITFGGGVNTSAPEMSSVSEASLSDGSWNAIISGDGFSRPCRGFTSFGAGTGSRKMMPFGKTWGGIKDIATADKTFVDGNVNTATDTISISAHGFFTGLSCTLTTTGTLPGGLALATTYYIIKTGSGTIRFASSLANALAGTATDITSAAGGGTHTVDVTGSAVAAVGNFFEDIGRSRWGIGAGQPAIEGTDVADFVLASILQVSVASGGTYSLPVQAGLNQPSAPSVGIVAGSIGDITNPISCKIERRRPSTGARSVASPTSAVITPQSNRVRVSFPLASTGQTHWRVYFTFQGFGGVGIHYLCNYAGVSDIPESLVSGGTVDGITRSLEFNFKDGDLIPIEASYDDYAPPAATGAIRLGNVLHLVGCNVDATSQPSGANQGTTIAVSKINNYESYIPTHLLYLPEQATDVLARPIDDFGYIACENSIHAIQFVGYRGEELPPSTITTVLSDIGIQYAHNWCHFRGRLAIYPAEGNLLLMNEDGSFDTSIHAPIAKSIRDWATSETIVGYDPKNDLLILANGKRIFTYSFAKRLWRQIWLPDFNVSGTVVSCTTAKRTLFITVANAGSNTVYSFDTAAATSIVPVSFCSNYLSGGNVLAVKDIYEMAIAAKSGTTSDIAVALAKNNKPSVFRRVTVNTGNNRIGNTSEIFTSDMLGKRVILFGENLTAPGTHYFHGVVSAFTSATNIGLKDLAGADFNPVTTVTELLMFVGEYTEIKTLSNDFPPNFFPNLTEMRSYCVNVWLRGANDTGDVLAAQTIGAAYGSSRTR